MHAEKIHDALFVEGLLTTETLYKYPLRASSYATICKAYSLEHGLSYTLNYQQLPKLTEKYYLTPKGITWLMEHFAKYSSEFLRSVYTPYFMRNDKTLLNNFYGISGERPKQGSKQKAMVVHQHKRVRKEYHFDQLRHARQFIFDNAKFYPLEEFTLYRIRTRMRGKSVDTFREKLPL